MAQLNRIERLKEHLSPYAFRQRFASVDLHDLSEAERFYLKNYGIYNIKLRPEAFMLRLRIAGGRIEPQRLATIAHIAREHGLEPLLTARAQIELHGLEAAQVWKVWDALRERGIVTLQTLGDNFRNIVTDPCDGVAVDARVEVWPLIERMQERFLDRPEWMGMLPRKCNTAICGREESAINFYGNDIFFALAKRDGRWGFNLYLGGKNSEAAQPAEIFVLPDEAVAMFEAIARAYSRYGLRGSRSRTRLFHLLQEIGMARFVEHIAEYYDGSIRPAGRLHYRKTPARSLTPLRDGGYGLCVESRFGMVTPEILLEIAQRAESEGLEIRLGADQNIHLMGCSKSVRTAYPSIEGACRITACAGSRYCALSLWNIKEETAYLPLQRLEKYRIDVGFSGCLKGCGRHQHADIGLVGLRTNLFGPVTRAARLFLGAGYGPGPRPARLIYYVVPLEHLKGLIDVIIDEYLESGAATFAAFAEAWLSRYSSGFLMLWFLSKLYLSVPIRLERAEERSLYRMLTRTPGFPKIEEEGEGYEKSVRFMMHALWDRAEAG